VLCARAAPTFLAEGLIGTAWQRRGGVDGRSGLHVSGYDAVFRGTQGSVGEDIPAGATVCVDWQKLTWQGREVKDVMIKPMSRFLREDINQFKVHHRLPTVLISSDPTQRLLPRPRTV
jgi:hypothetical protein